MKNLLLLLIISSFSVLASRAQWNQNYQASSTLNSIYFIDVQHGWAAGNGIILRTIDGGESWQTTSIGTEVELRAVQFVNTNHGWAVGTKKIGEMYSGVVYRTINGGLNWIEIDVPGAGWLTSCSFVDENTGWAADVGGRIFKTINGGTSWQMIATGSNNILVDVHFANHNNGWAVGNGGQILKSNDGGLNWDIQNFGTDNSFSSLFFASPYVGYVMGGKFDNMSTIFKTTDGGISWNKLNTDLIGKILAGYFFDEQVGYCVTDLSGIFKTTLRGVYWDYMNVNPPSIYGWSTEGDIYFSDEEHGWCVRSGRIYSLAETNDADTQHMLSSDYPLLKQNTPNPCSEETMIKFSVPTKSNVRIILHSAIGSINSELINQKYQAGEHEITVDVRHYQPGIYFYSLITKNAIETRKLVIE
jgi:photosystem II stability/assembly factor-like uncharacterized protein